MSTFTKRFPRQISKKEFYSRGGFANTNLFRKQRGKCWVYYEI